MDPHRLVQMANQIGTFFQAEPDRAAALDGIATHIKRFWDPRMRSELITWLDEHAGEGLSELAGAAIRANRDKLAA
jgi:formate dehydrogenase subunit delta